MSETRNTQVVQEAYAAFGRGDIPALLALLDPAVDWEAVAGAKTPTSGNWRGPDGVKTFFERLATSMEFTAFEPRQFLAQGETVVALGHYLGRARATGRTFESDWAMVFTVRNSLITRFRELADSAAINEAFASVAPV